MQRTISHNQFNPDHKLKGHLRDQRLTLTREKNKTVPHIIPIQNVRSPAVGWVRGWKHCPLGGGGEIV
eukprot:4756515-Amphidinium_carterae.1